MAQAGLRPHRAATCLALLVLCGCAGSPAGGSAEAGRLPPPRIHPGSLLLPASGASRPLRPDTCGAAALADLIGQPRTHIPVPVDLSRRRVACTACTVPSDVRLDRVNILFDAQTGLVTQITCG